MQILGVRIDAIGKNEALQKAVDFLNGNKPRTIFTPNPEMLVKAADDEYFKTVLNSGNLNLCDGFGLWLAIKYQVLSSKYQVLNIKNRRDRHFERIAGVDFMIELCRLASKEGRSVYLLGSGSEDVVRKAARNLQRQFPKLKIVGFDKGPVVNENIKSINNVTVKQSNKGLLINEQKNEKLLIDINGKNPDILFVAFGMGKQEKWIDQNLKKMPGVKIAMGVGGAFDYLSHKVRRAPLLMRKIGLEWLYRVVKQPCRAGRIFNATVKFIWHILWNKKYD